MSRIASLSLVLLVSLGLSACGKRGQLEPPPGQTEAARTAKAEAKVKAKEAGTPIDTSTSDTTKLGSKKRVPITPPKRDLFIDGLLD